MKKIVNSIAVDHCGNICSMDTVPCTPSYAEYMQHLAHVTHIHNVPQPSYMYPPYGLPTYPQYPAPMQYAPPPTYVPMPCPHCHVHKEVPGCTTTPVSKCDETCTETVGMCCNDTYLLGVAVQIVKALQVYNISNPLTNFDSMADIEIMTALGVNLDLCTDCYRIHFKRIQCGGITTAISFSVVPVPTTVKNCNGTCIIPQLKTFLGIEFGSGAPPVPTAALYKSSMPGAFPNFLGLDCATTTVTIPPNFVLV